MATKFTTFSRAATATEAMAETHEFFIENEYLVVDAFVSVEPGVEDDGTPGFDIEVFASPLCDCGKNEACPMWHENITRAKAEPVPPLLSAVT